MHAASPHDARRCDAALTHAFVVLGKRWNGMILSVLSGGEASFSDLRRALDGISDSMLSERLSELAANGLVTRTVAAGPPVSVRYDLTDGGHALEPALDQIRDWASVHLTRPA
ncbi:HxlR family transcriptional regulator [Microbacterium sp. AG1240]|uniref:winged helix-turn-helix transcriptional regulator n=1 Tax=Microbacterium sp. AG1240 TaxID=2183992 RepID=UPI000EAF9A13|nr:helix-turn-helix domain-containing protein [Microbacterium sp. AG1240]RKT31819.1 HxlR family transcriptional regulator [Microbacterium sp. AG1240]